MRSCNTSCQYSAKAYLIPPTEDGVIQMGVFESATKKYKYGARQQESNRIIPNNSIGLSSRNCPKAISPRLPLNP